MMEDIAQRVVSIIKVKILAAISIEVPVVGPILNFIEDWLLDQLRAALFESCDGVVATELRAMMGRDLFLLTDNGTKTVTVTTDHPGTTSPGNCGANSLYQVTWTIKPI